MNPEDLVIHLGDYILGSYIEYGSTIHSLNGEKILLLGNHDSKGYSWYIKNGFNFACEAFEWNYLGKHLLFSHQPREDNATFDINIHGHLHEGRHREEYNITHKHLLFSLEQEKYKPVLLKTFMAKKRAI